MEATEIQEVARRLFESRGTKAIAEAAQMARSMEKDGDKSKASDWRRIEAALMQLGGPRQS